MLIIGLTGGIGSGKSTVAELFAKHGVAITDTDVIAHQLTAKGQQALVDIAAVFGQDILLDDGNLNRALLRSKVFADTAAKKTLEDILHPRIRLAVAEDLAKPTPAPYRMVVVPLLFETGGYQQLVQRILVVDCPESLQVQRVLTRGLSNEAEIRAIIAAQCSREQRITQADDIIVNDSTQENLAHQVDAMHKKYIVLA